MQSNSLHVRLASTTVAQSRISAFSPTTRKRGHVETVQIKNAWGSAEITGDLTQRHRTVLDVLIGSQDEKRIRRRRNTDGSLEILVSLRKLLIALGYKQPGKAAYRDIEELIEDLRVTRFRATFKYRKKNVEIGVTRSVGIAAAHGPVMVNQMVIGYGVKLTAEYMGYYEADLPCHTEALTGQIAAIPSGFVQFVVRLLLTHNKSGSIKIATLLELAGLSSDKSRRKRARQDLRRSTERLQNDFGFEISKDTVVYRPHPKVWRGNAKEDGGGD